MPKYAELYDDTDTEVKSAWGGLRRSFMRCAAEMKFSVLLLLSLNGMNKRADEIADLRCRSLCATPGTKFFQDDVALCTSGCDDYTSRRTANSADFVVVLMLTAMNALVVIYILFRPSSALAFGLGKWRKSDTSLCFHINDYYCSRAVLGVRILSALGTLYLIVSDLYTSLRWGIPLGQIWSNNGNSWMPALIATWSLHTPKRELADASVRWRICSEDSIHTHMHLLRGCSEDSMHTSCAGACTQSTCITYTGALARLLGVCPAGRHI